MISNKKWMDGRDSVFEERMEDEKYDTTQKKVNQKSYVNKVVGRNDNEKSGSINELKSVIKYNFAQ